LLSRVEQAHKEAGQEIQESHQQLPGQASQHQLSTPSNLNRPEGAPEWTIASDVEIEDKEITPCSHPCISAIQSARKTLEFQDTDSELEESTDSDC